MVNKYFIIVKLDLVSGLRDCSVKGHLQIKSEPQPHRAGLHMLSPNIHREYTILSFHTDNLSFLLQVKHNASIQNDHQIIFLHRMSFKLSKFLLIQSKQQNERDFTSHSVNRMDNPFCYKKPNIIII